jgi:hypothetical protein
MIGFPLLLIPLAIYNIVAWLMPDVPLTDSMFHLTLVSGAQWTITLSDILLALGVLLLLLEIFKGARPGSKYLTDHLLSFVVFAGSAAEFLMLPKFATSTVFLLSLMAMVDFFSGIALRARRGKVMTAVSRRGAAQVEAVKPEPPAEPAHEMPAPAAAASVASTSGEPSPTIASPELQPDPGSAPEAPPR